MSVQGLGDVPRTLEGEELLLKPSLKGRCGVFPEFSVAARVKDVPHLVVIAGGVHDNSGVTLVCSKDVDRLILS